MHRQAVRHERPSVHASPDVKAWAATQAFRLFCRPALRLGATEYGRARSLGQFPPVARRVRGSAVISAEVDLGQAGGHSEVRDREGEPLRDSRPAKSCDATRRAAMSSFS